MFEYIFWCPSGFYLGALLFLVFIADLFYLNYDLDFASYADDTTPYICGQDFNSIIEVLEPNVNKLFNLFRQNGLLEKSGKSHFLTSPYERRSLKINDSVITSNFSEKLLGVLIDSELTFHDNITRLCSKANQKLSALARVSKYMTLQKRCLLIHKRALRTVYSDHKTSFLELLKRDKSVTIHKKNLQYLLIKTYKGKKGISPTIINGIFQFLKILSTNLEVVSNQKLTYSFLRH